MVNIKVVIGSSYGDEGKGLMTDYFCHQAYLQNQSCLNILTNGGAQRGHTVVHGNHRHVFHHFGSGTFSHADTYIAAPFILNPVVFAEEYEDLSRNHGIIPGKDFKVYVHGKCMVTTPYDMMYNKILLKNSGKHNSCGMGVWETLQRYKDGCQSFDRMCCLTDGSSGIYRYLGLIRDYYINKIKSNNIKCSDYWIALFMSDGLLEHYVQDFNLLKSIALDHNDVSWETYNTYVCENAQGLLLDKDCDKVYGTPSITGVGILKDVALINTMSIMNIEHNAEICYVTRSYLTRHGDGLLENECSKGNISTKINDSTNIPNDCQGTLRYGVLDLNSLHERVLNDFSKCTLKNTKLSYAVTHTDEALFNVSNISPDMAQCVRYISSSPDTLNVQDMQTS